jgi:hypothetical protein
MFSVSINYQARIEATLKKDLFKSDKSMRKTVDCKLWSVQGSRVHIFCHPDMLKNQLLILAV